MVVIGSISQSCPLVEGPITVTQFSRPFLSAFAALEAAGYVEEEFLLSGTAHVYEWVGADCKVKVVAGPGRYKTRVLVWRPRDVSKLSGNVEVTLLNASYGYDLGGPINPELLVSRGDVWIGLTTKPVAAAALRTWDATRYASLAWPNPATLERRCGYPSIIPAYTFGPDGEAALRTMGPLFSSPNTEDGLIWDIVGQCPPSAPMAQI